MAGTNDSLLNMQWRAQLPRLFAYGLLALGMLYCRADFLDDVFYNIDEGEYVVAADALNQGWLSGLDLLGSSKPPGIVLLVYALFHIFGRSLSVLHVAQLIAVILTGFLIIEIAHRFWGRKALIPTALLFCIVSNSFSLPQRMLSVNVESFGVLFVALALWLLLRTATRSAWLVAGLALGVAMTFRQSFVFFLIPAAYLALAQAQHWRSLSLLSVGVVAPWLVLLLPYALRGALSWTFDSWVRYPLDYASDIGLGGYFEALWLNTLEFAESEWPALVLALIGAVVLWRDRKRKQFVFLATLAMSSFLALSSGSRFTGQYWIQTYPVLALLGVAGWIALAQGRRVFRYGIAVLTVFGALTALGHFPQWRSWDESAPPKGISPYAIGAEQAELAAGMFARERTKPNDTILVWGYCPQIYYHAERLPGVRDYIVHYITGLSPGAFSPLEERAPRSSGHPRAQEMFLDDLMTRRPKYIFDLATIAEGEFPLVQYPLTLYPAVAGFIREHYVPDTTLGGIYVYRLKTHSPIS